MGQASKGIRLASTVKVADMEDRRRRARPGQPALRITRRAALLCAAALPLAGCWLFSGGEWKKKITVTVSTPAGDVSGSVVRWEKMTEDPVLSSAHSQERGEAVVVEVARGRYLFALIEDNKPQDELLFFPGEPPLESTGKLSRRKGEVIEVPITHYPMLVTFGDITDPKSVQQVLPNELAKHFGAGVTLKSITLEITDEPVTEGVIGKLIDWDDDLHGSIGKDMNLPPDHFLNRINDASFQRHARKK